MPWLYYDLYPCPQKSLQKASHSKKTGIPVQGKKHGFLPKQRLDVSSKL